jgi:outer membrane protein assembly factor BamD
MNRRLPILLSALLAACSTPKPKTAPEYFTSAEDLFESGAYGLAVEQYREMIDQHPFGEHTEEAELRIAHAHFLNESYIEAIAAFTDFQRRHPTSPYLPFVGYELGLAYKRQMQSPDRDQSAARSADTYFSAVVAQYPDSPYAILANEELADCRDSLAEHELNVARFYLRRGNFPAVETRALEIVGRYPQSTAADEALWALGRLYEESDDSRRAGLAYAALLQDHPLSARAAESESALARLGTSAPEVGPAAREALLAASGYTASKAEAGSAVAVPGIADDNRPFAAPPTGGVGLPIPPPRGNRGY